MPIRGFGPIGLRIIQTLRDHLPAELDFIDAEEAQAATPDVLDGSYHEYFRPIVPVFPAVRIQPRGFQPIDVKPVNHGAHLDAYYRFDVVVDTQLKTAADTPLTLHRWVITYTRGIFRVLCVRKVRLETAADPTAFAFNVEHDGAVRIGPEVEQEEGTAVRSGAVPIKVRQYETL